MRGLRSEHTLVFQLVQDFNHHLLQLVVPDISGAHAAAGSRRMHQFEVGQNALQNGTQGRVIDTLRIGQGLSSPAKVKAAQLGRRPESVGKFERN